MFYFSAHVLLHIFKIIRHVVGYNTKSIFVNVLKWHVQRDKFRRKSSSINKYRPGDKKKKKKTLCIIIIIVYVRHIYIDRMANFAKKKYIYCTRAGRSNYWQSNNSVTSSFKNHVLNTTLEIVFQANISSENLKKSVFKYCIQRRTIQG